MLYIALLLSALFVPGYLLSILFGISRYRFVTSITLSYGLFIAVVLSARWLELSLSGFNFLYGGIVVFILGLGFLIRRRSLFQEISLP